MEKKQALSRLKFKTIYLHIPTIFKNNFSYKLIASYLLML